jgi:hypothetical protein
MKKNNIGKEIWIMSTAGAFDWRPYTAYASKEKLVNQLNEDWGMNLTFEEIMDHDWQEENELRIEKVILYE